MNIERVVIKGLYHDLSYDIDFKDHDNVIFLTGDNGYGKTTILKILYMLSMKNLEFFYNLIFDEIEIYINDDTRLFINSLKNQEKEQDIDEDSDIDTSNSKELEFILRTPGKSATLLMDQRANTKLYNRFQRFYRNKFHEYTSSDISKNDLVEIINENVGLYEDALKEIYGEPPLLLVLEQLKLYFVESQRLAPQRFGILNRLKRGRVELIPSIKQLNLQLIEDMKREYVYFLENSQLSAEQLIKELDKCPKAYSKEEYEEHRTKLLSQVEKLERFGFSTKREILPYNKSNEALLTAYIQDLETKLSQSMGYINKLERFAELLENKEFVNKKVTYSPEEGIQAEHKALGYIDLNDLSSGEKNIIILLYRLVMEVEPNSMLLIDEPEISLHVVWQNDFCREITEIAALNNLRVIIATHSPSIIHTRWEDAFDLSSQEWGL